MASESFEKLDIEAGDSLNELFLLCEKGQLEAVETFLKAHGELSVVNARNLSGDLLIHVACANGHLALVRFLLASGASLLIAGQNGDFPLHNAARSGNLSLVTFLKEQGADLNKLNKAGETAIHVATRQGHVNVVEHLRLSGADVNIQNNRGSTALHIACKKKNPSMALMLLHLGCAMDLTDQMDEMAIHHACRENLLAVVQTMCSYGCKVEAENKSGFSPLHLAAKAGNIEIVRCLLLSGADIDKYNKDGIRAEDIALAQGHRDIADLLTQLCSSITRDKRDSYVKQLLPTSEEICCMKIKVFGSGGVGKTTLIDSLKCGYFRSLFRRVYSSYNIPIPAKEPYAIKPRRKKTLQVPYENYTRGISVEQANLYEAGDVSLWEFSGYEPYYGIYDYFIGDPNCLHVVVVSMKDPEDVRKAQLHFWLNFIRARFTPAEPFGYAGNQLWAPHILLVATHGDVGSGCLRNPKGELTMENEIKITQELERLFHADLILSRKFIVLDAHQPMSTEMKNLRVTIAKSKELISQYLPMSLGFLDNTIAELPSWKKMLPGFPVIRWNNFKEYIRTRVNLLATDEHLKELVYQLQVAGEIVYLEAPKEDVVIIDPNWFGTEIVGKVLSYENIACAPEDGKLSLEDLCVHFPQLDGGDLMMLLELLNICTRCSTTEDLKFVFPILNTTDGTPIAWAGAELKDDVICGGVRIVSPPEYADQFVHIFPRVVVAFYQAIQTTKGSSMTDSSSRCKIKMDGMSALVSLVDDGRVFKIECRGTNEQRSALFAFQQMIFDIVVSVFQQTCPGIYLEQNPISPTHLAQSKPTPRVYTAGEVLTAQLNGQSTLQLDADTNTTESLADVITFGSQEVFSSLEPGLDLHISNLSLFSRMQLAAMLDPNFHDASEQDKFADVLNLDKQRLHELADTSQLSNTDKMLAIWSQNPASTIRQLHQMLKEYERPSAASLLLSLSPMYNSKNLNKVF